MHPIKPFDDKRVRQALRYAIDTPADLKLAHRGLGHGRRASSRRPVHPEYAKLPRFKRDVAKAKKLLADAGYPNGIDAEIRAGPNRTGSCSPCRRWSSNGRRPASASRST